MVDDARVRRRGVLLAIAVLAVLVITVVMVAPVCDRTPRPSLIETAEQERAPQVLRDGYEKREGLHIDIPYLAGKRYDELDPAIVADQLGTELSREQLPHWGVVEIDFGLKRIRLYDDEIHYIAYTFEAPMDLTTAMGVSGFPLRVPATIEATEECRLVRHWGMRQVSLIRTAPDADTFREIRVWKVRPQEIEALR